MDRVLKFCSYHLSADPERHEAAYGARLLWDEVMSGGQGVVHDRQDVFGPRESVEGEIFPVLDRWYAKTRVELMPQDGGSDKSVDLREGRVVVCGGPQASHGYLYVTAVLEKP